MSSIRRPGAHCVRGISRPVATNRTSALFMISLRHRVFQYPPPIVTRNSVGVARKDIHSAPPSMWLVSVVAHAAPVKRLSDKMASHGYASWPLLAVGDGLSRNTRGALRNTNSSAPTIIALPNTFIMRRNTGAGSARRAAPSVRRASGPLHHAPFVFYAIE